MKSCRLKLIKITPLYVSTYILHCIRQIRLAKLRLMVEIFLDLYSCQTLHKHSLLLYFWKRPEVGCRFTSELMWTSKCEDLWMHVKNHVAINSKTENIDRILRILLPYWYFCGKIMIIMRLFNQKKCILSHDISVYQRQPQHFICDRVYQKSTIGIIEMTCIPLIALAW